MKSILIIGMGRFGRHLADKMQKLGNEVMIVDDDEKAIQDLSSQFEDSYIGDCTNESVVESLCVDEFDICFVCIGEDFQSSLLVTSLLKKHGASHVVSKSNQSIQEELLLKIGADEVVYPERDIAEKVAIKYNSKNIFDFVPLTSEFSIYEIPIISTWVGNSVLKVNVRKKYKVNIIAIKNKKELNVLPSPEYIFKPDDHIVIIGKSNDVFHLAART